MNYMSMPLIGFQQFAQEQNGPFSSWRKFLGIVLVQNGACWTSSRERKPVIRLNSGVKRQHGFTELSSSAIYWEYLSVPPASFFPVCCVHEIKARTSSQNVVHSLIQ
jgi:hypothetical protein